MGASAAMFLFAIGVMGTLFLAVIAFVNLWGYSQIEAALAITPIAVLGVVVSPLVGRRADRVPPRAMAAPALRDDGRRPGVAGRSRSPPSPTTCAVLAPLIVVGLGHGGGLPVHERGRDGLDLGPGARRWARAS